MNIVNCWSDGIWSPTESRDVSKSQLPLLLASCFVLFELWLVMCHSLKDLRELLRSTGLRCCFSSSCCTHPSSMDSFNLSKEWNNTRDPHRYMSSLTVSQFFCVLTPLSFPPSCTTSPFPFYCSLSCFIAVRPHTPAICGYALEVLFAQIKVCNEWAFAPSGPLCQAWQCVVWQDDTWAWKNNTGATCVSCLFIKIYC